MGSTTDRIKGATNEAVGKGKQAIGDAIDDPSMEAEGAGQEIKGKAQTAEGKAKDAVKNVVDKA